MLLLFEKKELILCIFCEYCSEVTVPVTASIVTCHLWTYIYCTVGVFICALAKIGVSTLMSSIKEKVLIYNSPHGFVFIASNKRCTSECEDCFFRQIKQQL